MGNTPDAWVAVMAGLVPMLMPGRSLTSE